MELLSGTSHISSAQLPHVACCCYSILDSTERGHFLQCGKSYWTELCWFFKCWGEKAP